MPVTIVPTSLRYKDGNQFVSADCLKGETGDTPVITAEKAGKQTSVIVNGTVIATILDGNDGSPGHSPVITASKSGKTTTISVDGTPIATILDGEDGGSGDDKADKTDTVLNTTLSRGRKSNSTVGDGSIAFGYIVEASGSQSVGFGSLIEAKGSQSFAHGYEVVARGARSSAGGYGTIAQGVNSDVSGMYNVADSYGNWPDWQPNTFYDAKAKVHLQVQSSGETYDYYYICKTPHTSGTTWDSHSSYWEYDNGYMNYAHIVGNGKDYRHRSNAYALDWEGNGHYAGDVYVGCNADGSGGVKLEPVVFATDAHTREIFATV